jgi:homoserine kinase type II
MHEELLDEAKGVMGAWGMVGRSASAVPGGTLNWNFRVETGEGVYFLRCVRANLETERIAGEHELVAWVAERGVPAPVPIPTADGKTIALVGDRRWALLPWMPGAPVERGTLSPAQARSLGSMHGRVQVVLAGHPASEGARMIGRWDKQQSLDLLDRLIAKARERGEAEWIVAGIESQRRMLDALDVLPPEAFASLPCQVLHGDFHDQQALFVGDEVSAIVDWEIWHTDPRAWELARSLAFSTLFPSPRLEDYLAGYREHVRLGEDEVRLAMRNWFQSRVVGLWAWWAYLMEGNDRVAAFFPEMIAELERMATPGWTKSVTERVLRAAAR